MAECLVDRANGMINSDDQPVQVDLKVEPTLHQPATHSSHLLSHPFSSANLPLPLSPTFPTLSPPPLLLQPTSTTPHPNRSMADREKRRRPLINTDARHCTLLPSATTT
jgi:hypothetical protein